MTAKHIFIALVSVFVLYSAFKKADAVQSIVFKGETYELSESYRQSGSKVYMYTPGGGNFLRAGKYIQVVHLRSVDMPADVYRRQFMETIKRGDSFKSLSDNAFFYVESNTAVHSALVQEDDSFKLYGYAEIQSGEQAEALSNNNAKRSIARELESTISMLPPPPSAFTTWF